VFSALGDVRRSLLRVEPVIVFTSDTDRIAAVELPELPGVTIRDVRADDEGRLRGLLSRQPVADRMARGDVGVVAESGNEIIGVAWAAFRPLRIGWIQLVVSPEPGQATVYGLIVRPAWRRRGLGRALSRAAALAAQDRGARQIVNHASAWEQTIPAMMDLVDARVRERLLVAVIANRFCFTLSRQRGDKLSNPRSTTAV
jgi:ribosomal protein S18 acetylase RimI-like enzyme